MEPSKPTGQPAERSATVTLREVTAETVRDICDLSVAPEQTSYVASNAVSIAEAHFAPEAWFRAVYADETPVGFVMLYQDTAKPEYSLWRFMVDARYQGRGFGKRALLLVIDHVRTLPGATELWLSYVPGAHAPVAFYRSLGFVETGAENEGELEMRLELGA
jgi:diamine N-acetyltransferase